MLCELSPRTMSRIGKAPISLPKGVEITISDKNLVTVKGPKGTLVQPVDPDMTVKQDAGVVSLERPSDAKPHRAKHGLYRSLIANMVKGVSEGFVIEQELVGVVTALPRRANNSNWHWASRTPSPSTFPRRSR